MKCHYYYTDQCQSCQYLQQDYVAQLASKQSHLISLMESIPVANWFPIEQSPESAFRYKAKMVVSGSVENPILGIINHNGVAVDVTQCRLYPKAMFNYFHILVNFIRRSGLVPYDLEKRKGELKYILLTQAYSSDQIMIRFVLRSEKKVHSIRCHLPWLATQLPPKSVVSANIQPTHMAILEGEQEIVLSVDSYLREKLNDVTLFLQSKSFFQTNPYIAEKLYATARQWVSDLPVKIIWDLFCGVGGFGFHCVDADKQLIGIEISENAIVCAQRAAEEMNLQNVSFQALDSSLFAQQQSTDVDLIIVNPPRRGLGESLCHSLSGVAADYILYSSCHAETMVKDIRALSEYRIKAIKQFDMFPYTSHYEVMALLIHNKKID